MTATDPHLSSSAPDAGACAGLTDPFAILSTCHEHIQEKLGTLELAANALLLDDGFSEATLARLCDALTMLDTAVPIHSADEEETLFPVLRSLTDLTGESPMDCMEHEHEFHEGLLMDLKLAITQRNARRAGQLALDIVAEYRHHIRKEEEVLYPWARSILRAESQLAWMAQEMLDRRRRAGVLPSC